MKTPLQNRKQINMITILFAATYMVSYITRINFGAIISEMEEATKISRSLLSMSITGSFITYGIGQIISGLCGDRFSPKKLLTYGLVATVVMNLLIPVCKNPYQMLTVWCINGFAQSFMWPPMVRLMTVFFSEEEYKKASVNISWGSSIGTIAVYLISPLIISVFGWKAVFIFSAICGIIMIFVWNKYCYEIETVKERTVHNENPKSMNVLFTPLMICVMIAIILQGMLRDGVTTWMPSYISETYNLSNIISILTGVVLPIFSILCFQITSRLYRKAFTNPLLCAGIIFGAGSFAALALFLLSGQNAAFSVFFSALLTGAMHGVNLMLICMIPPFFKKYGNVSTVSGVLNSCTYIGSAISTYGIAVLSEKLGWEYTLLIWLLIAIAGTVICLVCTKPWKKHYSN
ncbi:MAG: MFS transporter [Clostridia bacterium]|nr:MFS transporter [Clostridia bacterium]